MSSGVWSLVSGIVGVAFVIWFFNAMSKWGDGPDDDRNKGNPFTDRRGFPPDDEDDWKA